MQKQKILSGLTDRGGMRTCLLVLVSLAFIGCAQFQHKVPEALPFMEIEQIFKNLIFILCFFSGTF